MFIRSQTVPGCRPIKVRGSSGCWSGTDWIAKLISFCYRLNNQLHWSGLCVFIFHVSNWFTICRKTCYSLMDELCYKLLSKESVQFWQVRVLCVCSLCRWRKVEKRCGFSEFISVRTERREPLTGEWTTSTCAPPCSTSHPIIDTLALFTGAELDQNPAVCRLGVTVQRITCS